MRNLTSADPDTIMDADRVAMDDALADFRFARPGNRGWSSDRCATRAEHCRRCTTCGRTRQVAWRARR